MPKEKVNARVSPECIEKIKQMAKEQNRTFSGMVSHLLEQGVKQLNK